MGEDLGGGFTRMDPDFVKKVQQMSKKDREDYAERMNNVLKKIRELQPKIFKKLIEDGKISMDEVKEYSADYMVEYLNMVAFFRAPGTEMPIFMTTSGELLKVRDKLQEKFGVEIMDPGEAMDRAEAEKKKNAGYIS